MKKILSLAVSALVCATSLSAGENVSSLDKYLNSIKIGGDLRVGYLSYKYNNEASMGKNTSTTAIGGSVKFDLPIYKDNINFVVAPYFAKSFDELSNDNIDTEYESLASKNGDFMMLGEANLNLAYDNFGLVVGRQIINTPLMGDDDLRLTHQTFQGAMANYKFETLSLYAGYFNRWQGYDASLLDIGGKGLNDFERIGTTQSDGVALAGIEFEDSLSFSNVNSRLYYYDIDKYSKVFYGDVNFNNEITKEISTDIAFQYTNQSEQDASGKDASLYGAMLGLGYNDLYVFSSYTKSSLDTGKSLFNGFGGEFYYTAMNEWAMGYLSDGLDEKALQFGLSYDLTDKFNLSTYTTTFKNDVEKVRENDLLLSYSFSEKLMAEAMYFNVTDKKDDDNSYDIFFARLTYSF